MMPGLALYFVLHFRKLVCCSAELELLLYCSISVGPITPLNLFLLA